MDTQKTCGSLRASGLPMLVGFLTRLANLLVYRQRRLCYFCGYRHVAIYAVPPVSDGRPTECTRCRQQMEWPNEW